ncbi:hypothetical protein DPMN_088827 [Dreissena polymorpha]|uniref:Uncharacterized protein n=1 Tax=Dreissena polymorpha TaxID=45954 RepID=A0A9D4QY85_DREPO|nr:hypothetical protein DPMN_088827 [Dreissena polymorpha]
MVTADVFAKKRYCIRLFDTDIEPFRRLYEIDLVVVAECFLWEQSVVQGDRVVANSRGINPLSLVLLVPNLPTVPDKYSTMRIYFFGNLSMMRTSSEHNC